MDLYIAVIGDIKNSKKLEERNEIQHKLNNVLNRVNREYESSIAAKFMITLGDEFQGLLYSGKNVVDIIEEIQWDMYPLNIRFGVGFGTIATDINPEMAIGADGPAYHKAREAIQQLKTNEQKTRIQVSDIRIGIEDDNHSISMMLNTILTLMAMIRRNWSERQREIIFRIEKYKESQTECAKHLEITQSSVQRGLKNGNYYAYREAKETVQNIFKEIGEIDV